jgi:radical SAM protein with 4Fe4S-binding SPASM domain
MRKTNRQLVLMNEITVLKSQVTSAEYHSLCSSALGKSCESCLLFPSCDKGCLFQTGRVNRYLHRDSVGDADDLRNDSRRARG